MGNLSRKTNIAITATCAGVTALVMIIVFGIKETKKLEIKSSVWIFLWGCLIVFIISLIVVAAKDPTACDPTCSGGTPICDDGTCVPCGKDNMCPLVTPICKPDGSCNKCTDNKECPTDKPICKEDGTCIECKDDTHCPTDKPICNPWKGICLECDDNHACINTEKVCSGNRCVRCTRYIHCPEGKSCNDGSCVDKIRV